jgi:membrane protease YdiL (CAAX protease family)
MVFPLFSVPVQGATGALAPRCGEIGARIITEGAIWSYAALVLAIAWLGERRSLASIGLRRPTFGIILWGFGGAVALLAIGGLSSFVTYEVLHQPNRSPADVEALIRGSLVYALCLALRGAVIEEIFYRGLAIEQLGALTGRRWLAALIATLVFIFAHALRFDARQLFPIATVAFGFAGLYLWRRNLWINIVAHFLIDAVALGAVALRATSLY